MNKNFIKLLVILLLSLSLVGCSSSTNDKSFIDGFKRSFKDDAIELDNDYDIEYALFSNNWEVRVDQRGRLAELLKRMIGKKGYAIPIQVNEGYFTFSSSHGTVTNGFHLDIVANCLINGEPRWLFIDCGNPYVYDKRLHLSKKWFLSLQDNNRTDVNEPWAWCYYDKGEIEDEFWQPYITYASENYMYMTSGIYLRSY